MLAKCSFGQITPECNAVARDFGGCQSGLLKHAFILPMLQRNSHFVVLNQVSLTSRKSNKIFPFL